jgi:hypothetical protein
MELLSNYRIGEDDTLVDWEMNRAKEAAAQRAPIVLGEWGFDWTWENAPVFMDEVHEMADRMMLSWAYWPGDPNRWDNPGGWSIWDWENSDDKDGIAERAAAAAAAAAAAVTDPVTGADTRWALVMTVSSSGPTEGTPSFRIERPKTRSFNSSSSSMRHEGRRTA